MKVENEIKKMVEVYKKFEKNIFDKNECAFHTFLNQLAQLEEEREMFRQKAKSLGVEVDPPPVGNSLKKYGTLLRNFYCTLYGWSVWED